ncbi:AraC family transcriptional regulator [Aureibacter tunicatorum]|uniref:AraC-like DNA-binding protein n=1 Tax=Aureibacter tunicatorum TaxID=866807 RepID=A0AAE3XMF2_9BACT|nr:AraC family transcriptional regulator [Aureibacter tunicatorum]MDR6238673.1 AraC-like DNA-binding protein [Aureibacter tunicatorum]BDD05396.1 transcription regulator [Aureibacter tunicatorum]
MIIESTNQLFEISTEELSVWEKRPHKQNFFEIVYIEKGSGLQCVNEHEFEYHGGNIFLLPPLDCHSFIIKQTSIFHFIRFTDHFFMSDSGFTDYKIWFDQMAHILANYNKIPGDIISTPRERDYIVNSINFIQNEYSNIDSYSNSIIMEIMASIVNILARSIEKKYIEQNDQLDKRFGEILRFINSNILENDKLRVSSLAENFNISKTYFSEYFKKQAGISLAEYILNSKLKIAETKILHTKLSLKEIAYQLNFTDSSHLSKAFKKKNGVTIKMFKANPHSIYQTNLNQ